MDKRTKAALNKFRDVLEDKLDSQRGSATYIKSDDIVDDDACDNVTTAAQDIATAFNELAPLLGLKAIAVPEDNPPGPNQ